ncbi:MAG: NADH-quinone oxidoreductase subunit C [Bacteroidetes bacterium]|jgi:NADH-quinone oxidoreductase subunit C|nr:NADH-quinone oxidoreductase subunit C [Bacteroidota bacterium]
MTTEELKIIMEELLPGASFEEGTEWLTLNTGPEGFKNFALQLRNREDILFDYLFCMTAVDWKTHFSMVYHFSSTVFRHTLVVKVKLDKNEPAVDTLSAIWRTAEMHEREAYDLMGIVFTDHPDLRRLFLTPDHEGYPLRKDYEDPVNMIKL